MPPRKSAPGVKAKRFRTEKEKPFDPEVEFGGGVKTRGTSSYPHSKKNREARAGLRGPPLAIERAKDAHRAIKSRALREGITTSEMAAEVGLPIGTTRAQIDIAQDSRFTTLIERYISIKLCRRKVMIYEKWQELSEEDQRRFLGIGPDDDLPEFRIPPNELELAGPPKDNFRIILSNPPFPGFDGSLYILFVVREQSKDTNASLLADEAMYEVIDTSNDHETLFSGDSDPETDIEPVCKDYASPVHN